MSTRNLSLSSQPGRSTSSSSSTGTGSSSSGGDYSSLFPGKAYVPSGLTAEQYQQVKQDEALRQSKMDFGAWGPRFHRSERPQGDWFVMPQLWTTGFNSNNKQIGPDPASATPTPAAALKHRNRLLKSVPSFLLAYIAIDSLLMAWAIFFTSHQMTLKKAAALVLTFIFRRKLVFATWWKVLLAKTIVASALTRPIQQFYLEDFSRRRLWTQRRLWSVTVGVMVGALAVFSVAVAAIQGPNFKFL